MLCYGAMDVRQPAMKIQPFGGALPMAMQQQQQQPQNPGAMQPEAMFAQTPPVALAQSPQAMAFQKLLEQSVDLAREDSEQRAVEEDTSLQELVTRALRDPSDSESDEAPPNLAAPTSLTGVHGFYSPLADIDG
jgi:hypothetical protein